MSKKPSQQDWHRADIKGALDKAGWSMAALSRAHNYSPGSLRVVLLTPWPKVEAIFGAAIGVPPQTIWPSRYREDGSPKSSRHERGIGRHKTNLVTIEPNKQYSKNTKACNVNVVVGK